MGGEGGETIIAEGVLEEDPSSTAAGEAGIPYHNSKKLLRCIYAFLIIFSEYFPDRRLV